MSDHERTDLRSLNNSTNSPNTSTMLYILHAIADVAHSCSDLGLLNSSTKWHKRTYESIELNQNPICWMPAGSCPQPPRLDRGESTEVLPQRYWPGALIASKLETRPGNGKEFGHRSKALPHSVVCCAELC